MFPYEWLLAVRPSDPPKGRIEVDMEGPKRKRSSEIINLYSLEAS